MNQGSSTVEDECGFAVYYLKGVLAENKYLHSTVRNMGFGKNN